MARLNFAWPQVLMPVADEESATLNQDWVVDVRGWVISIPRHFKFDGASIPRALWTVCGHPLTSPRVYAALVHDFLYGGGGPREIDRAEADAIYRELLVRFGWGSFRAWIEWSAIRLCGGSHWSSNRL